MFNLDEHIGAWRQRLLERDTVGPTEVDELEDHLRQEATQLSRRGLTDQEAFHVATMRLGAVEALDNEYSKVVGPALLVRRLQWMLIGYLSFTTLNQMGGIVLQFFSSGMLSIGLTWRWVVLFHATGMLLLAVAVLRSIVISLNRPSSPIHRLVATSDDYLSRRLKVVTAAMFSSWLVGYLLQIQQIHLLQKHINLQSGSGSSFTAFMSSRNYLSIIWYIGLPISIAILTMWARRRIERGEAAR
jgi:cellulose synthase/poly-beta-1,6-N-acetylglucosamine synthase-like glycosyltransferase